MFAIFIINNDFTGCGVVQSEEVCNMLKTVIVIKIDLGISDIKTAELDSTPFIILLQFLQTLANCLLATEQLLIYPLYLCSAATLLWEKFSSSKIVCQHTMHIRRSSCCNVKLHCSFFRTCGFRTALILIQLTGAQPAQCRIECIRCQFKTYLTWGSAWLMLVTEQCESCCWWMA